MRDIERIADSAPVFKRGTIRVYFSPAGQSIYVKLPIQVNHE